MYSSNTSLNGNELISYPNQPFCFRPFSVESNPTNSSKEESNTNYALPLPPPPPPLSFFQSPFDENIFLEHHHDFLLLHHYLADSGVLTKNLDVAAEISPIPCPGQGSIAMDHTPRKRSSKRDRHSKINTARGLRDRRMRLSLEVAKRFFGLQDMLGFEKASKTVDWLLNQAKGEIKQLAREKTSVGGAKSASSTSECEGVSSLDEVVVSRGVNEEPERERVPNMKRRTNKVCRKSAFNPIDKESREKARERARERTREKMRTRRVLADASNLNRLSSWNPFETIEHSVGTTHQSQSVNHPSLDVHLPEADQEQSSHNSKEHLGENMANEDNSLAIMNKWSPTMMFNSIHNSGILQEHQFAEFQSLGKPWGAYSTHI